MPCVRPSPWLSIHIFVVMSVRSTGYEQHEKPVFYYKSLTRHIHSFSTTTGRKA